MTDLKAEIEELLQNEDINKQIDGVKKIAEASPSDRKELLQKVSKMFNHEIREVAATQIEQSPSEYILFLTDPDPHVRIAIIQNSIKLRKSEKDILNKLKSVTNDPISEVRCSFAQILYQHAIFKDESGKIDEKSLNEIILPCLISLLKDKNDDVKIMASQNLEPLIIEFGFDFIFNKLFESLQKMLVDPQWRVRRFAIHILFELSLVCNEEYFNKNLFPLLVKFLRDPCFALRKFSCSKLGSLASNFGDKWLKGPLATELLKLADSSNFLERETYLYCISELSDFFSGEYQADFVFEPMIKMLRDPIQNVVLLAIEELYKHQNDIHPFRKQYELKPILEKLTESSPPSTQAKATQLLESLQ